MKSKMNFEPDELCRNCGEKQICDYNIFLCEECYNKFKDAVVDTLPNLDPSYNPDMTVAERDQQIASMGQSFHLDLNETKEVIDSLE